MQKQKTFSSLILLALEKTIDGYVRLEDFAYNPHKYISGYPRILKKNSLSKAISRLRERGLIELTDGNDFIRLSREGKDEIFWIKINSINESKNGNWTVVFFDVPENRRSARDLFRNKLKNCGFIQWQKSVWASRKNCTLELREFVKNAGIDRWVIVLKSNDTGTTLFYDRKNMSQK